MFKSMSDKMSFIERTGSHATKPRPSGRIDDIPSWAAEPENYYNSTRDQYRSIADQMTKAQETLAGLNEKLRSSLPFKEYEHLRQHKERLGARYGILQEQAKAYRELARAAGEKAWATVFYHVAHKLLSPDDFRILVDETKQLLGREEYEISNGRAMWSEGKRESRKEHDRRRERRANWNKHKTGTVTVWSDDGPTKQQYQDELRRK